MGTLNPKPLTLNPKPLRYLSRDERKAQSSPGDRSGFSQLQTQGSRPFLTQLTGFYLFLPLHKPENLQ